MQFIYYKFIKLNNYLKFRIRRAIKLFKSQIKKLDSTIKILKGQIFELKYSSQ